MDQLSSVLPEVDRKAISETPDVGGYIVATFREALKLGVDGWVDDDLAFVNPWGFDLAEIKCPVALWHGDLDMMVPYTHGKWLAEHLPQGGLTAHLVPGEGHISITYQYMADQLDEVLAILSSREHSS